ncbi:hypothetical protein Gohar_021573 [Gossypium harknessii]|uniref:Uncharacterized protein n=1 Tax=Gossypium harknessii TaxID=34285 RepID=A0A7J9IDI0_9ROSI|nr:hypothetical protein [Gossypium harknessii]
MVLGRNVLGAELRMRPLFIPIKIALHLGRSSLLVV